MFALASSEKRAKNYAVVGDSRDGPRFAQWLDLEEKRPIISFGIWAGLPNDEEDQMLGNQRSQLVCARAKNAQLQKGLLPCWSFYIQLWDLVVTPGFWAPPDHQSVRWFSHRASAKQNRVQLVPQTS